MGWLEIIGLVLQLGFAILVEVFGGQARARKADEKYEIDKIKLKVIAETCLAKLLEDAPKESKQARDVEDQVDNEVNKP